MVSLQHNLLSNKAIGLIEGWCGDSQGLKTINIKNNDLLIKNKQFYKQVEALGQRGVRVIH